MTGATVNVLYIAGSGRCGSTLLSGLLERTPGVMGPGELLNLWERGVREGHPCGCGLTVPACPVWSDVLAEVAGSELQPLAVKMMALQQQVARTVHLPLLLSRRGRDRLNGPLNEYIEQLDRLYQAIARRTQATLIVDTSKAPGYGAALALGPSIDLRMVHLVRDPRAVAYSWMRKRELVPSPSGAPVYMHQARAVESTTLWLRYNGGADLVRRSLPRDRSIRIRYEDFVANPQPALASIARLSGLPERAFDLGDGATVTLETNHSVSGNPSRFRSGPVTLASDDQWRAALPARDRRRVMALAWPLAWRYGYR